MPLGLTHSQFALFCHERQHQLGFGFWGDTNNTIKWNPIDMGEQHEDTIVFISRLEERLLCTTCPKGMKEDGESIHMYTRTADIKTLTRGENI